MADDIDDLLDEVESKFCEPKQKKQSNNKSRHQNKPKVNSTSSGSSSVRLDSDISDAVRDILGDDDDLDLKLEQITKTKVRKKPLTATNSAGIKCFPIFLSGTAKSANDSSIRVCDRLHCTTCDNKIVTFENFEWNSSCDYLFFRNNYPDFSKLKSKLISHAGSRVYCCQCCWIAIKRPTKLEDCSSFKWICKRH